MTTPAPGSTEMFRFEKDMTAIVEAWMKDQGLLVKREVWLSWGNCDLVGCELDRDQIAVRTLKRQRTPICQSGIPDKLGDLSWWPFYKRLIVVELKLHRYAEVIDQARRHIKYWAPESYIGMPADNAVRLRDRRGDELLRQGVGILAVTPDGVEELQPSSINTDYASDNWHRFRITECFWRERKKLGYAA